MPEAANKQKTTTTHGAFELYAKRDSPQQVIFLLMLKTVTVIIEKHRKP